jgi:hypothetical protein
MTKSSSLALWPRLRSASWQCPALRLDWLAPIRSLDENVFFPHRYAELTERLRPHLADVTSVLDVGASCGRLARRLMDATGCHIVGIDVCLQPHSQIEVLRYDGRTFPFPDGRFDCVMMVDMLHHSIDIAQMLREACRVARRYVLIKDHYSDTPLDLAGLRLADYLGNAPYGVSLPYNYLRPEEWSGLFHRHGLKAVSTDNFRLHLLDPCKHMVVKLQVTGQKSNFLVPAHC